MEVKFHEFCELRVLIIFAGTNFHKINKKLTKFAKFNSCEVDKEKVSCALLTHLSKALAVVRTLCIAKLHAFDFDN